MAGEGGFVSLHPTVTGNEDVDRASGLTKVIDSSTVNAKPAVLHEAMRTSPSRALVNRRRCAMFASITKSHTRRLPTTVRP